MNIEQITTRNWVNENPLRRWRTDQKPKVSMMDAAAKVGVSMMSVQLWENGGMTPAPENMHRIAEIIGTSVDRLTEAWQGWRDGRPQA